MDLNQREQGAPDGNQLSPADNEALMMGRSIQRMINRKIVECFAVATEELIGQIREIVAETPGAPAQAGRYIDSAEIARRLGIHPATVERLCRRGDIDAVKTKGNQWRTTAERLRKSRYLRGERRSRKGERPD